MKLLYRYNMVTKEFDGVVAQLTDPLESIIRGHEVYVVPPFCTEVEPPICGPNETCVFNEKENMWEVYGDYRGMVLYKEKTGEPIVVRELGDLPEGYVKEKPVILKEEKDKVLREINKVFLEEYCKDVVYNKNIIRADELLILSSNAELSSTGKVSFCTNDGDLVELTKEEIEGIKEERNRRMTFLPERKAELIKKVKKAKSLKELAKIKVNFEE